jgi:hypothetical protein
VLADPGRFQTDPDPDPVPIRGSADPTTRRGGSGNIGCYQMVPLPANAVRGMYSHMFKRLRFKGYLQEKGSLAIDP